MRGVGLGFPLFKEAKDDFQNLLGRGICLYLIKENLDCLVEVGSTEVQRAKDT